MRYRLDPFAPSGVSLAPPPQRQLIRQQSTGAIVSGGTTGRTSYVTPVASDPASGEDGDMIYNYTDNVIKVWWAGVWNTMSGGGTTDPATFDFIDGGDFMFIDGTGFDFIT